MKNLMIILLFVLPFLAFGQNETVTKTYEVANLESIDLSAFSEVTFENSNKNKVTITYSVKKHVDLQVENGNGHFGAKMKQYHNSGRKSKSGKVMISGNDVAKVVVQIPLSKLEKANFNAISDIDFNDTWDSDEISIVMNACGELSGSIDTQELELNLNASSLKTLKGSAETADIDLNASSIKMRNLEISEVDIRLNVSSANINADDIYVENINLSSLNYIGSPDIEVNSKNMSSVDQID